MIVLNQTKHFILKAYFLKYELDLVLF